MNDLDLSHYPPHLVEKILKRVEQKKHPRPERERYVNALRNFVLFKKNRSHFMHLILTLQKDSVEDMVYFSNKPLEKNLSFTDPALYKFLSEVLSAFKQTNYHQINYLGMMEEIKKRNNPKKISLN